MNEFNNSGPEMTMIRWAVKIMYKNYPKTGSCEYQL